jgi:phospho-N-acetylmuramoyl-pentapeptide-transferase
VLSELLFSWRDSFGALNVFHYITFRSALGALSAFLACFLLLPRWIEWFRRRGVGQIIRADGPSSHGQKAGTPTMGGFIVVTAIAAGMMLWAKPGPLVWLSLLALAWFGAIGLVDDLRKLRERHSRGLSARAKLAWQIAGAAGLAALYLHLTQGGLDQPGRLALPFWKHDVMVPGWAYVLLATVVMVGTTNAVNLTDGLDGLAAGSLALAAGGLAVMAYLAGNARFSAYLNIPFVPAAGELAVVLAILTGACLGFLWFNAPPAQVFMGDVGALGMGGLLGAVAVFARAEIALIVFGAVFVIEALSVLAQVGFYKLRRRRILLMAPLHHHFELRGVPEPKVIVRFWIFSVLLIIAMLMTLKLR